MSLADDERINDETIPDVRDQSLFRTWRPPSIDDLVTFGKYKERAWSYRELAKHDAGYAKWAAMNINGLRGQLCAEALAEHLGVTTGTFVQWLCTKIDQDNPIGDLARDVVDSGHCSAGTIDELRQLIRSSPGDSKASALEALKEAEAEWKRGQR